MTDTTDDQQLPDEEELVAGAVRDPSVAALLIAKASQADELGVRGVADGADPGAAHRAGADLDEADRHRTSAPS